MGQGKTGKESEARVIQKLQSSDLLAEKVKPDRGVDIVTWKEGMKKGNAIKIQVKGRGVKQTNKRYRWFQVRPSENKKAEEKIRMVDFFVLVSLNYNELWVFNTAQIFKIIKRTKHNYNRKGGNLEIDLDAPMDNKKGKTAYDEFKDHCNNFQPIIDELNKRLLNSANL